VFFANIEKKLKSDVLCLNAYDNSSPVRVMAKKSFFNTLEGISCSGKRRCMAYSPSSTVNLSLVFIFYRLNSPRRGRFLGENARGVIKTLMKLGINPARIIIALKGSPILQKAEPKDALPMIF